MRMTFEAGMGAEAIKKLLAEIDLEKLSEELREELEHATGQKRVRLLKRLEVCRELPGDPATSAPSG